jgi:hypothetical protein
MDTAVNGSWIASTSWSVGGVLARILMALSTGRK